MEEEQVLLGDVADGVGTSYDKKNMQDGFQNQGAFDLEEMKVNQEQDDPRTPCQHSKPYGMEAATPGTLWDTYYGRTPEPQLWKQDQEETDEETEPEYIGGDLRIPAVPDTLFADVRVVLENCSRAFDPGHFTKMEQKVAESGFVSRKELDMAHEQLLATRKTLTKALQENSELKAKLEYSQNDCYAYRNALIEFQEEVVERSLRLQELEEEAALAAAEQSQRSDGGVALAVRERENYTEHELSGTAAWGIRSSLSDLRDELRKSKEGHALAEGSHGVMNLTRQCTDVMGKVVATKHDREEALRKRVRILEGDVQDLQIELELARADGEELKLELQVCSIEKLTLTERFEGAMEEVDRLEGASRALTEELQHSHQIAEERDTELKSRNQQIVDLQAACERLKGEKLAEVNALLREKEKWSENMLEDKIARLEHEQKLDASHSALQMTRAEAQRVQEEVDQLREKQKSLEVRCAEGDLAKEALNAELHRTRSECADAAKSLKNANLELQKQGSVLASVEESAKAAEGRANLSEARCMELKEELGKANARVLEQVAKLEALTTQFKEVEGQKIDFQQRYQELEAKVKEKLHAEKIRASALSSLESKVMSLEELQQHFQMELLRRDVLLVEHEIQVKKSVTKLEESQRHSTSRQRELLEQQVEELKRQVTMLEKRRKEETDRLEAAYYDVEQELLRLKSEARFTSIPSIAECGAAVRGAVQHGKTGAGTPSFARTSMTSVSRSLSDALSHATAEQASPDKSLKSGAYWKRDGGSRIPLVPAKSEVLNTVSKNSADSGGEATRGCYSVSKLPKYSAR